MHFQGSKLTYLVEPTLRINGQHVPAGSGERFYPAAPGRYRLDVSMQWMLTYGRARCDVDVPPGPPVHVWYAPPATQFQKGAIGFAQQKRRGLAIFYAALAVVLAVVILAVVVGAATS